MYNIYAGVVYTRAFSDVKLYQLDKKEGLGFILSICKVVPLLEVSRDKEKWLCRDWQRLIILSSKKRSSFVSIRSILGAFLFRIVDINILHIPV